MAPRTHAQFAHALSVAHDLDAALVALGEALADVDRAAQVALMRLDGKRAMLEDALHVRGNTIERIRLETTFDHIPPTARPNIESGGGFVDLGDKSTDYARLFGFTPLPDGGLLSLRGIRHEGQLVAVLVLQESKRIFGARTAERFAPSVALFDIGKTRTKEFLDRVEFRLHERNIRTTRCGKPTNAKVATPENLQKIAAEADVVLIALSD